MLVELFEQRRTLACDLGEPLQAFGIPGNQLAAAAVDETTPCSWFGVHQTLIVRRERHRRHQSDDVAQILGGSGVDASPVRASGRNRHLIGGGIGVSLAGGDVGSDRCLAFAAFHQRQRGRHPVAAAGGKHFDRFDQIGFAQSVRTVQHVYTGDEIDHDLAPRAEVIECETRNVHGCRIPRGCSGSGIFGYQV